ncbi:MULTISPECIES: hypothetical protein [Pseudomonas]|uniref:hypothetical protein n=1 Tax=Pseudomonas TaxID=286 RepID=UPI00273A6655|nr:MULTISPECIES: hypothetical protein [unclassified Pseudomonas]
MASFCKPLNSDYFCRSEGFFAITAFSSLQGLQISSIPVAAIVGEFQLFQHLRLALGVQIRHPRIHYAVARAGVLWGINGGLGSLNAWEVAGLCAGFVGLCIAWRHATHLKAFRYKHPNTDSIILISHNARHNNSAV